MALAELQGPVTAGRDGIEEALGGLGVGLCVVDPDGHIVACSPAFRELLGYPAELAAVGRPFAGLLRFDLERGVVGPDLVGHALRRLGGSHAAAGETAVRIAPDGRRVDLRTGPAPGGGLIQLCSAQASPGPAPEPCATQATPPGEDVGEVAREAGEETRRAERRLFDALESLPEGLAQFDAHGHLVFANRRYRELFAPIADRIVEGVGLDALARLKLEGGLFVTGETPVEELIAWYAGLHCQPEEFFELQLADGRWLRMNDRRMSDGGIVSVRADISELKRREITLVEMSEELRRQNVRFDIALNNMVQGLCLLDSEKRLIVCNKRYLEMYRFSAEVVKPGISLREIMEYSVSLGNYRNEDAARAVAERSSFASKRQQGVLLQHLSDGRVIAVMHQPMADGGSVATFEDVTQTVRAEEALRDYAAKLERSNRELQDFASIASHDLQEPLRKIEAFGGRLQARYAAELGENGAMYVDRMQHAAGRMRTLINDLLSYSRVTTKAQPFQPLDLGVIAGEVVQDLQIAIEQAEARVEIDALLTIDGDATQMRQLIQNLVGNALKFRKPGVAPVVRISARIEEAETGDPEAGRCEIRIADNGIGFEQKYADRIFGIFQRLHGRNEYEGTGIGLATCRKIADRHGGSIAAFGVPGQGSTFVINLPLRQQTGDSAS